MVSETKKTKVKDRAEDKECYEKKGINEWITAGRGT